MGRSRNRRTLMNAVNVMESANAMVSAKSANAMESAKRLLSIYNVELTTSEPSKAYRRYL